MTGAQIPRDQQSNLSAIERRAHWYRVRVCAGVLVAGAVSLLVLIEVAAAVAHWLQGVL